MDTKIRKILEDPLNAKLITLIYAAPIGDSEKESWLSILPVMTSDEKNRLAANLENALKIYSQVWSGRK